MIIFIFNVRNTIALPWLLPLPPWWSCAYGWRMPTYHPYSFKPNDPHLFIFNIPVKQKSSCSPEIALRWAQGAKGTYVPILAAHSDRDHTTPCNPL
jgi:hypothetical protein